MTHQPIRSKELPDPTQEYVLSPTPEETVESHNDDSWPCYLIFNISYMVHEPPALACNLIRTHTVSGDIGSPASFAGSLSGVFGGRTCGG